MLTARRGGLKDGAATAENSGGIGRLRLSVDPRSTSASTLLRMRLAVHIVLFSGLTGGALALRLALERVLLGPTPPKRQPEPRDDADRSSREAA